MDQTLSVRAADLINGLTRHELTLLFEKYAEEPASKKIAETIVEKRAEKPITTTRELAVILEKRLGRFGKIHPATRVFQALRIAVNDELHAFEEGIVRGWPLLRRGGRMVVVSFHSLEDRIAKRAFLQFANDGSGSILTDKPLLPEESEIQKNTRSRSAKLRAIEKIL